MIELYNERFCLTIPLGDAINFALGQSDLSLHEPSDYLRQLLGLLALDQLEYTEQWRTAGLFRRFLAEEWPELGL